MEDKILYKDEIYAIQGAIFEVYTTLGCGFLEAVYQESLEKEFFNRGTPFVAQAEIKIDYKGEVLKQIYKADFICFGKIIVELKAIGAFGPEHFAQLFNYVKAAKLQLGLLVNFGHYPKVKIERIVM